MSFPFKLALLMGSSVFGLATTAAGAQAPRSGFFIPAENLGSALQSLSEQSGVAVVAASSLVAGVSSASVAGDRSVGDALAHMLAGSGLRAEKVGGTYVVRPAPARVGPSAAAADDIVVTGTRIRGAAPIGAPLTVIDRKAIEQSGRATVADYIQTLPQNYAGGPNEENYGTSPRNGAGDNQSYASSINLRGLGTQSTLVLFDGNRPALGGTSGAFVDLSLIPSSAIDRIEILTDGASAIYGTDAVAGVVNVRFRNRLDGFETRLYSGTAGGAFDQFQLGQAAGKRWSTGGFMIAYQYDHRGALSGADRRASTEDLRLWGGPDYRSPFAAPGNIIADDGSIYAIPAGQDGRHLGVDQLLPGTKNLVDRRKTIDLLPSQTSHSVYAAGDQDFGGGFTGYARALYAHRRFATINPLSSLDPVTVPVTNPFYVDPTGTHQPVEVEYDFSREVGPERQTGSVDGLTTSAGLKKQIAAWRFEAAASYGRQVEKSHSENVTSDTRIAAALADTDPATALNVFGDGTGNNPATINAIRASYYDMSRYAVWSISLRADGPLFALPAGTIKLAVGAEHRDERFTGVDYSTTETVTPLAAPTYGTPAHRNIDAVYAELSIPVLGPDTDHFPGRLDVSLAGRIDSYSDVGRTANPKAGLRWEPTPGLSLRGSYGTSFRAPGFTENIGASHNVYEPIVLPDPASPTGSTGVLAEIGTAPVITPEKATSWTVGIDLQPHAISGLTISASYFDIAYRDRVGTANPDYASFFTQRDIYGGLIEDHPDPAKVAALYADPGFTNPFGVPASAIGAIFDLELRNLSRVTTRGVDFTVNYAHSLFGGTASAGIAGTRLLAIDQRITADAPAQNVVGTFYNPVKLRARAHAGWAKGGFDASAFVNYTGGYTNQIVTPNAHVASWTTVDGQIGYRFNTPSPLAGVRLALSVVNLFNRQPPYIENHFFDSTLAYDPGQANAIGRLISVQATLSW